MDTVATLRSLHATISTGALDNVDYASQGIDIRALDSASYRSCYTAAPSRAGARDKKGGSAGRSAQQCGPAVEVRS